MAYTTINKSTDYFNTNLYTGNSGELAITGVGFQPDFWWGKKRSAAGSHVLANAVSGANKFLYTDANLAETTYNEAVKSFDSDGVTIGTAGDISGNGLDFVSWNWKAGTTGSGNTTGSGDSKAYSYSVNTTPGFSIIKYIGNGTTNHTIPHHLGVSPEWILVKDLDAATNWQMYHVSLGNTYTTEINIQNAPFQSSSRWNNTTPSSTVVTLGNGNNTNNNNTNYIMFAFAAKTGYSKFGSYTGNGNTDGTFVYTGFKPAFIMARKSSSTGNLVLVDTKRDGYNGANDTLSANTTDAESGGNRFDILSNGFKARSTSSYSNSSGDTFIYMAFAAAPLVGTNNIPCTAR